jgi:NADPH:quinone reductase-like Zn-dependent oxidoreductase
MTPETMQAVVLTRFGGDGSYAEQHVADVELVGRRPENLSHLEAASLSLLGDTVNLPDRRP